MESRLLSNICCCIGISSSQRKRNIQSTDCEATLINMIYFSEVCINTMIICGSRSEGIYPFPLRPDAFQDLDMMFMIDDISVREHVDTTHTNQEEVLQLLYTDSPEHVLLEVKSYERKCETYDNTSLSWLPMVIVSIDRMDLVSSLGVKFILHERFTMRAHFFQSLPTTYVKDLRNDYFNFCLNSKMAIHGPAATTEHIPAAGTSTSDIVRCIRCNEWPTAAHEWIDRARSHGWPSQDLIDQIQNDGCELVPVGRKDHPCEDVEWKLSFSRTETRLIRTFNIYQAQCFQLLKIVKTHFISSVVADSLSSYHIKTVMLHTVEQTDPKVWRRDNLAQCFIMCLSNLKRFLADKFLPHYFIVRQNLLEPKVTGDVHQKVLEIVTDLDKIGWKCILQCPPLQNLCPFVQETVGSKPCSIITGLYSLKGNKYLIDSVCSTLLLNVLSEEDRVSYNCYLIRIVVFCEKTFLKPTTKHPSVETARVLQLLRKATLGFLLIVIRAMAHPDIRPGIEPMMNLARQCLEESCFADMSSCRLKLATFYFHLGEYYRCIETVHDVLDRFKDVWVVGGGVYTPRDISIEQLQNFDTSKLELNLNRVLQLSGNGFPCISNHLSIPVIFTRWEVAVAPKGVQFVHKEMPRLIMFTSISCCIDSIVYAHYILLECYLKLDEHDLAEHALINMKESIRNGNDDMFDKNCLCFCEEDKVLLQYSESLMKVARNVTLKRGTRNFEIDLVG